MSRSGRGAKQPMKGKGKPSHNGEADLWAHEYGRPAMERMMRIHRKIEDKEYPNCRTLAREFEMSLRTLKRDIEFMKDSLKMPIEFDVPKNGYSFTRSVPHFPRVPLTEKEIVGLFVAQKTIAQYRGTALEPVLEAAFRKMTAQLDDAVKFSLGNLEELVSIRPFAPGDAELEKFDLLTVAMRERRAVRFLYRNHGKLKLLPKHVWPWHVAYVNNQWTLFAFDPKQNGLRKFVLLRMRRPELTEERFAPLGSFDLDKELSGSMGVFKGTEDYEVVVEFDAWGADDVRGRRWHSSQILTELPKGRLRVKLRLNSLEEISRWVLGFEDHATVIEPAALRDRINKIARELLNRYATKGEQEVIMNEGRKDLMSLVMDAAETCVAAIWVNLSPDAPPSSVKDNGTCAFVDTGQRKLLITAYHVLSDFFGKQKANPQAVLCVCLGSISMYLDAPVVVDFDEEVLDLAVIEFPHLDRIQNHQKRYFPIREFPIPIARRGESVTLVGFPGVRRFTHAEFGAFEPAGLGFSVTSVSDRSVLLADESGTRRTEGIGFREDEDIPLGGFSGTPGFVARENGFHLIGFLRAGSKQFEGGPPMVLPGVVFLSPATYLKVDGTLDRHRMPYCPAGPRNSERGVSS